MSLYADTGIFVALYLSDSHSNEVQKLVGQFRPHFWVTPLLRAEWSHAVYQRVSGKDLGATEARQVMAKFDHDRDLGRWRETAMPTNAVERSMALARAHPNLRATTSDTLHVATALELRAVQFWTFSPQAAALATAERLVVISPSASEDALMVGRRR